MTVAPAGPKVVRQRGASSGTGRFRVPLWIVRVALIGVLLALVELGVRLRFLDPFFVPLPSRVVVGMARSIADPGYLRLVAVTLGEVLAAFVIAGTVGVAVGFVLWRSVRAGQAFEPVVAALFSSPIVLLYPIFLVVMGRTPTAIVALAAVFATLPTILYTRMALREVRRTLLDVGRSLGLGTWSLFRHVMLPAAAPTIFTGLRVALTYVLIVVIAMEYILQIGGLGLSVAEASLRFQAVDLYVSVGLTVAISATLMWLIAHLQRVVTR
ncbi:ABC transporter permease subunit [Pseudonocardia nematodicida]|uniref:ABC transporter permease subunit n=1 Tax=Pseudonocardia nematodicida TaxID=1206997 RepID=A0ABV1K8C0_9PSEU